MREGRASTSRGTRAAVENEGNVMLLQVVNDRMLHRRFGDMGAFQFWILPEGPARGNRDAVRLTFEIS